jgi:hypothetical protein
MMKNWIVFIVMAAALMGCATTAERMEREARTAAQVSEALASRHYTINVLMMYPQRGRAVNLTTNYSVEVKGDSLISYLPYFGRAYNVPYGGGKGLNFTAPIGSYQEYMKRNGLRHIEIGVTNEEDTYFYTIEVFDNGSSSVDVRARQRERISYSGNIEL